MVSVCGHLLDLAEHLGRGGLVIPDLLHQAGLADGLENALGAQAVDVAGVFRDVEADPHVRLGPQIVDFVRLQLIEQLHHLHRVGQVAVVQEEPHPIDMRILVKVVDPAGVEGGGPADDAVDLIALGEQELRQIGAVLARDAGNERFLHKNWRPVSAKRPVVARRADQRVRNQVPRVSQRVRGGRPAKQAVVASVPPLGDFPEEAFGAYLI